MTMSVRAHARNCGKSVDLAWNGREDSVSQSTLYDDYPIIPGKASQLSSDSEENVLSGRNIQEVHQIVSPDAFALLQGDARSEG
jgi:hypothetical protein